MKDSNMTAKNISRLLYWKVMPMAIGFVMFYYLDKMEISLLYKVFIFLAIAIPVATIRIFIGMKFFKEEPMLADKIMSCSLRKKYGHDYCAICPDGYSCSSDNIDSTSGMGTSDQDKEIIR